MTVLEVLAINTPSSAEGCPRSRPSPVPGEAGIEGGEPHSVEGQVAAIIDQARDPQRLSAMFYGWGAWV